MLVLAGFTSLAQIPKTLNFQGVLVNPSDNQAVADGNYSFIFSIYNVVSGGTVLWTESHGLATVDGVYSVILGATTPIDIDGTEEYWLGVNVNSFELGRVKLTSSAYLLDDRLENLAATGNINGNAATVTTNANLTGIVTSIGNVTSIANGAIPDTKLATVSSAGKVANSATTAVSSNTSNAIVARDVSGNFSAGTITADLVGDVSGNATTATNLNGNLPASQIIGIPIPVAWGHIDGFNYSDATNKYYTIKSSSSNILWVKEAYQGDEGWFPGTYTIKLSGIDLNDGEYLIISNLTSSFSSSISAGQYASFSTLISVYIVNISDSHMDYPSQNAFNQGDFYFMVYKVK